MTEVLAFLRSLDAIGDAGDGGGVPGDVPLQAGGEGVPGGEGEGEGEEEQQGQEFEHP